MDTTNTGFMLTGRTYRITKMFAQVWLPAFGALYFGLAGIWGLPAADQIVGSVTVIDTFLGVMLGISQARYDASGAAFGGSIVVTESAKGKKLFSLEIDGDPNDLEQHGSIAFKIDKRTAPLPEDEE